MGKSVAIGVVPFVPCSKRKPCDLGSISKSLEAAMGKLEALRRGYDSGMHTKKATSSHGVPREPKPPDLYQGGHHLLHKCSKSSPALRGRGMTPLLPYFNGENSRTFVSWLYDVECYFKSKCFSEEMKLELVVSCLKGVALLWYNTLNFSRRMEGKGRISSWFKLEMNMRLKFLPCPILDELWTELKSLKQNSLSVIEYAKLFEELHFVCDKEVDHVKKGVRFYHGLKSEISKRINLELNNSYGKLHKLALCVEKSLARSRNHEVLAKRESLEAMKTVGNEEGLNQRVVRPCLDVACPKPKSIEQDIKGAYATCPAVLKSLHHNIETTLNSTFETTNQEEEQAYTNLDLLHNASKDQVTGLGPLELVVNQGLPNLLNLKSGLSMMKFSGGDVWDSIKGEAREESWVVPCPNVPNLTPCTRPDICFKTNILGGITCTLSTPHFHFYMLVRLQVSLDHLGTIPYMLSMKIGDMNYNIYMLPWSDVVNCFGKFRGSKYHSWVLSILLSRMSISETFILLHSKWKLLFNSEMDQLKPCWPVLKLLYFEVNIVQIHCKGLLEMSGVSSASSLHGLKGFSALLVMFMLRIMHKNSSRPLIALLCSTSCVDAHYGLSLSEYMLLVLAYDIVVVKLGVEPPWPSVKGYMDSIERKTGMGTNRGNESALTSSLNVHFSILVAELLGVALMSPRQVIMVFDPGKTSPPTVIREFLNEGESMHQQVLLCPKCACENPENSGLKYQQWFDLLNRPKHTLWVHDPGINPCGCGQPPRRSNQGSEALKDEFGKGVTQFLPFTILIYDPGGGRNIYSLEVAFKLERV